jgi:hypothetical protein
MGKARSTIARAGTLAAIDDRVIGTQVGTPFAGSVPGVVIDDVAPTLLSDPDGGTDLLAPVRRFAG